MSRRTGSLINQRGSEDELLNDRFHALLRDAAEKREGRERIQSAEDAVAARQESVDLLSLARSQSRAQANRKTGRGPSSQSDSHAKAERSGQQHAQR